MRCLCCGKEIKETASAEELHQIWHKRCVKKFFGTNTLPNIEVDDHKLELLAESNARKGLTIPGVQKKLSLHLSKEDGKNRLTIVDYPTGYILKPPAEEFQFLPEMEYVAMRLAELSGINTVPYALIHTEENYAYITKRIDRDIQKINVKKYAMEDFCQLSGRITQDKYRGSYEQCAKIVSRYSARPGLDLSELFIRIVFSFVIGNSDMHLKNFSLIEEISGKREYHMSAAYDILPVNVVMPEDKEEMALTLNGKKQNLRRKDFLIFAEKCGLERKTAERIIEKIVSMETKYLEEIEKSILAQTSKEELEGLVRARLLRLKKVTKE